MPKLESITTAGHSLDFAVRDLRDGLKGATRLESIVLLAMIKRAADLAAEARELAAAMQETEGTENSLESPEAGLLSQTAT